MVIIRRVYYIVMASMAVTMTVRAKQATTTIGAKKKGQAAMQQGMKTTGVEPKAILEKKMHPF